MTELNVQALLGNSQDLIPQSTQTLVQRVLEKGGIHYLQSMLSQVRVFLFFDMGTKCKMGRGVS